jgi:hypothetical protein
VNGLGWLLRTFVFAYVPFPLGLARLANFAWLFLLVISRSTHPIHHHPVYFFSETERWLVSLAETREIFGQVEISGRIDIGAALDN